MFTVSLVTKHTVLFIGTPPRLDGKTIDFSKTEIKYGDDPPEPFSFINDQVWIKVSVTYVEVQEIIHGSHRFVFLKSWVWHLYSYILS